MKSNFINIYFNNSLLNKVRFSKMKRIDRTIDYWENWQGRGRPVRSNVRYGKQWSLGYLKLFLELAIDFSLFSCFLLYVFLCLFYWFLFQYGRIYFFLCWIKNIWVSSWGRWYVLPTSYLWERQRFFKINFYGKRKCKEIAVQCRRTDL